MTLTELLLFIMASSFVTWLGGATVGTMLGRQLRRSAPDALGPFCTAFSTVAGPAFGGSSLLVLGTGLGIVLRDGGPAFGDGWVFGAFACWLVGMLLGATVVGLTWTKVGRLLREGNSFDEVDPVIRRATYWTWLDQAVLSLGLLLVIWQPGA